MFFIKHQCLNQQFKGLGDIKNVALLLNKPLNTKFPGLIEAIPTLNLEVKICHVRVGTVLKSPLKRCLGDVSTFS